MDKSLTCCFCNKTNSCLEHLKAHSAACQHHPAVKELASLHALIAEKDSLIKKVLDDGFLGGGHYGLEKALSLQPTSSSQKAGSDKIKEVLEWYADPENYKGRVHMKLGKLLPLVLSDRGERAREVLHSQSEKGEGED